MQKFFVFVSFLVMLFSCTSNTQEEQWLWQQPVKGQEFVENRIFLNIPTESGDTVRFYTDTGGGKMIYPEPVRRLGLMIDSTETEGRITETVSLSSFFEANGYPPPKDEQFIYRGEVWEGEQVDGILGANWFADKTWNFDYQNKTLYLVDSVHWASISVTEKTPIGFMTSSLGEHLTNFPRIPIIVEGDTIQTLFDSGAMVRLSAEGQQEFGFPNVATSFIIASIFDQWSAQHPDWPIIQEGDLQFKEDMIQVPAVSIGGHTVGPVWFTRRADQNFTEFMSKWMDQPIEGAIGASCFQHFRTIVIDYSGELAYFEE